MGWDALKAGMDRHHGFERFCAGVIFCAAALACLTGFAWADHLEARRIDLGTRAVYTESFSFSKTGAAGEVVGVFANEERTRGMVALKFADVGDVSIDAKNYQAFLTYSEQEGNPETPVDHMSGSLAVFGQTGYAAVVVADREGIESQVLDLVVRASAELVPEEDFDPDQVEETTYDVYDQAQVFFNPGAEGATVIGSLSGETVDYAEVYRDIVTSGVEAEAKAELEEDLRLMRASLAKAEEYAARLEADGVAVPELPEVVRGDAVEKDEDGTLSLRSASVLPRGFDVDWRGASLAEGGSYLAQATDDPENAVRFLAARAKEAERPSLFSSDMVWTMEDGSLVEELDTGSDDLGPYVQVQNDISGWKGAWEEYYAQKREHQTKHMRRLLTAEADLAAVASSLTVAAGEDACVAF